MAEIQEKARWVDDIYRIQKTDAILGGEDGVINIQPTQIVQRTAFLKQSAEAEHTEGGRHQVTNDMVADDAAIDESKLLFEVPLKTVTLALEGATKEVGELKKDVVDVIGNDGILIHGLTKTVLLDWKYADFGFEFEMWTGDLIMRDIENRTVTCAVADDDSVDVTDSSGLRRGMRLLISDGASAEEVEIRELLDKGRIILKDVLKNTYRTPAILGTRTGRSRKDWLRAPREPCTTPRSRPCWNSRRAARSSYAVTPVPESWPSSTVTAAFPARGRTPRCARSP